MTGPSAILTETLEHLAVAAREGGAAGTAPSWFGEVLFGGFVVGQAVSAASCHAPEGRRVHSLHAYFLRPVLAGRPVDYAVEVVRAGRAFATARLEAAQDQRVALTALVSYTADGDGYVYDLGGGDPLPPLDEAAAEPGPGPWESVSLGPSAPRADGTLDSTSRMWFRIPEDLPDDAVVHAALMGFATDWTGTGGRPLHLDGDTGGMVSLDHAVWFHRPSRVDEWHFYDVQSLVNAGGRSLLRGVVRDRHGRVVASMAQEMRLTPV